MATVLTIQGKDYDVDRDFTWEEIMLVEELAGVPLGRQGAFESMAVIGGFVFAIQKRADETLTWEQFVKQPLEVTDGDEKPEAAKPRPTRAKATA